MQRNGLVQRRVASTSNANGDVDKDSETNPSADDSSKETRFTLMEEVLLLGLKDKEVGINLRILFSNELIFPRFLGLHILLE